MGWILNASGTMGVHDVSALKGNFFFNSHTSYGPKENVWTTVDLTAHGIPADALSIDVSGILIVTMGTTPGFVDLVVSFKRPSETRPPNVNYVMQVVANTGDGMRSNASTILVPENSKIDWSWRTSGGALGWPNNASVGCNLSIERWFR